MNERKKEKTMAGPCMCGDPLCGRCFPGAAKLEAAAEWAMEEFSMAGLRAEEYEIAVKVGIVAVMRAREYAKFRLEEQKMIDQEGKMFQEGA
jgi:hypothetical protein